MANAIHLVHSDGSNVVTVVCTMAHSILLDKNLNVSSIYQQQAFLRNLEHCCQSFMLVLLLEPKKPPHPESENKKIGQYL